MLVSTSRSCRFTPKSSDRIGATGTLEAGGGHSESPTPDARGPRQHPDPEAGPTMREGSIEAPDRQPIDWRSEEHTSELQSLMRISYAVFCLKKKQQNNN